MSGPAWKNPPGNYNSSGSFPPWKPPSAWPYAYATASSSELKKLVEAMEALEAKTKHKNPKLPSKYKPTTPSKSKLTVKLAAAEEKIATLEGEIAKLKKAAAYDLQNIIAAQESAEKWKHACADLEVEYADLEVKAEAPVLWHAELKPDGVIECPPGKSIIVEAVYRVVEGLLLLAHADAPMLPDRIHFDQFVLVPGDFLTTYKATYILVGRIVPAVPAPMTLPKAITKVYDGPGMPGPVWSPLVQFKNPGKFTVDYTWGAAPPSVTNIDGVKVTLLGGAYSGSIITTKTK